ASLTRKSPTGSVAEFLGSCDLFSWQCNKQTVVANSTTEAEYVAVASCCGQNLEGGIKFLMYPRFMQVFLDKQVEGMTKHKEIYVTPSHTKKVFANMKRGGKGFSREVTPLFQTMMVQALKELERGGELRGEGVDEKGEVENERNLEIIQRPLFKLKIAKLKERVNKLERRNKSRTPGLKRLRKVGRTARIESSEDEGLDLNKKTKQLNTYAVTTAATTTTTDVTRPKARGVIVQEPKIAQRLQEELQAELQEEERLARQKVEDANIVEWDNVQAMIDADYELAARLQAQEQEELTIKERANGSSKRYSSMIKMLQNIDKEDLETLPGSWLKQNIEIQGQMRQMKEFEEGYLLQVEYICEISESAHIFMLSLYSPISLVEKRYPLTPATITEMLNKKLQADHWNKICYQLLTLMTKQLKNPGSV
ncbi:hypothetical protein Tco_0923395, partial [Tanacetum coccineum]